MPKLAVEGSVETVLHVVVSRRLDTGGEAYQTFEPSAILLLIKACPSIPVPLSGRSNLVRPSLFEILHRVVVVFIRFREQLRVTELCSDSQFFLETI
jgi:hypothetical protein